MTRKHTMSGNCWKIAYSCKDGCGDNLCDVCHEHDEPRGECSVCHPCRACEDEDAEAEIDEPLAQYHVYDASR